MNCRPAQHLKDNNLFAVVSNLHTEFSHLCIDPMFYLAYVMKSIPSEYSSPSLSSGVVQSTIWCITYCGGCVHAG